MAPGGKHYEARASYVAESGAQGTGYQTLLSPRRRLKKILEACKAAMTWMSLRTVAYPYAKL